MAPYIRSQGHDARSPSPVAASRRRIKPGKLLGNFGCVYQQFPELGLDDQHQPSGGSPRQQPTKNIILEETIKVDVPQQANYREWESRSAVPACVTPKLGKLDKLEKLGLHCKGSSKKAILSQLNQRSTSEVCHGLNARLQNSRPIPRPIPAYTVHLKKVYGPSINNSTGPDSSFTIVETESALDADDESLDDSVSKATTPATSPDFTLDIQAKIDAIVSKSAPSGNNQDTATPPIKVEANFPIGAWPGTKPTSAQGPGQQFPQIPHYLSFASSPCNLAHFQETAQRYRSNIAACVAANFAVLRPGEAITLPWDEHGSYTVVESPDHHKFGVSYGNKSKYIIEPHFRVDKATHLGIVKARLAQTDLPRQLTHARSAAAHADTPVVVLDPTHVDRSSQPIHVFVDMSNIVIGFYNSIRQKRNIALHQRIKASFFFEALATILERERPCAKRVVAGSMRPGAPWEDYMFEAQSRGYSMHILQRVKGMKPSKVLAQDSPSTNLPAIGGNVHHEQGVDEILQLHMLQSIVDTPAPFSGSAEPLSPGTMVLATGDGAEAEFSDGFFNNVLRALKHGWCVEVVGFQRNMNQLWHEQAIPAEWRAQFRTIFLDDFTEELLASFH